MVKVKICGITRRRDAEDAVELGADFLGFNFYPPSPRHITPALARALQADLPATAVSVGVFVNMEAERVREICEAGNIGIAQLHGEESPAFCSTLGIPVLKGLRVAGPDDLANVNIYQIWGILLDAKSPGYGGSGKTIDWSLAASVTNVSRLFLAGGLTPGNVAEAIARVKPWAVDTASGVESAPGIKDREKMKRFIEAVKNADVS